METQEILVKYYPTKDNLLLILHDIQNHTPGNYINEESLKEVAKFLNTTYSNVYGVATYYSMFSLKKRGKHLIRLCKSPLCRMVGIEDILSSIKKELNIEFGQTTSDEMFTLEPSECLGQCDKAPAMLIDDKLFTNLDTQKTRDIIKNYIAKNKNQAS